MNRRERRTQWQVSHRHPAPQISMFPGRSPAAPVPAFSAVRIQIGELVLRGFEKRQASRIAAAFERSLHERLRASALPDALRHRMTSSSVRLAPLTLRRAADPVAIGEQLAASVFAFERESRRHGGPR